MPWSTARGCPEHEPFTGWSYVLICPLYAVGLLLGLIVLLTKEYPFGISLIAGILMFLGVIEGIAAEGPAGNLTKLSDGIWFALLWSIVFTIAGPILGRHMTQIGKG